LFKSYKWKFASVSVLCKRIEHNSEILKDAMGRIQERFAKAKKIDEELKKLKPELNDAQEKAAQLKEYHPELQLKVLDLKEKVSDKNQMLIDSLKTILNETEKATGCLKRIFDDADSVIYHENKELDRKFLKISSIDPELRHAIAVKINESKEEFMGIATKMFELAKAEEKGIFRGYEKRGKPVSEDIENMGIKMDEVGRVLQKLSIDDIDDITGSCEAQINLVKRTGFESVALMNQIESMFTEARIMANLTDQRLAHNSEYVERNFKEAKHEMTLNAEHILADIKLLPAKKVQEF
jgi:hypothetical protein